MNKLKGNYDYLKFLFIKTSIIPKSKLTMDEAISLLFIAGINS